MTLGTMDCFETAVFNHSKTHVLCAKGTQGIVFNGEVGEVIKLHPKIDVAYINFIRWVITLTDETFINHFPKVHLFTEHEDYITVVMERLYKHSDLSEIEQARIPLYLCPYDVGVSEAFEQAKHRFLYATDLKLKREYIRPAWKRFKVIDSLEDAMQALLVHVHTTDYACDLHDENIMFRRMPDGSCIAVVIDPFSC